MTELERRDIPAWWSVAAPVPVEGTAVITDATHAGSLGFRPALSATNGTATVWADTAALAVTKALTGTISVTLSGQTVEYAFGPATVGATAADHKAFLPVVSGTSFALAFEDMAGQPGCDYDYNDRSWSGVTVTGTGNPVVAYPGPHSWAWLNPDTADSATVGLEVTRPDDVTFRWAYTLANNNMATLFVSPGVNQFHVSPDDTSGVTKLTTSMAGWDMVVTNKMVYWRVPCMTSGPYLAIGSTAKFGFDTPVVPITAATGGAAVAGVDGGGTASATMTADGDHPWAESSPSMAGPDTCVALEDVCGGPTVGPGVPPKADIDIDGSVAGAAFTEVTEDSIGGLVVRDSIVDMNKAPRQKVIVQQILDANNAPFPNVKVKVTGQGGSVDLYDAVTGGNKVPAGTLLDNANLPKSFWVQGVTGSTTMRDVKLAATPVLGNVAVANGADEVAFTVLWVDVVVATSGYISPDNDKRDNYENWTELGTSKLGLQRYTNFNGYGNRIGWGVESRGKVSPANFLYPGVDIKLGRDWEAKFYINGVQTPDAYVFGMRSRPLARSGICW